MQELDQNYYRCKQEHIPPLFLPPPLLPLPTFPPPFPVFSHLSSYYPFNVQVRHSTHWKDFAPQHHQHHVTYYEDEDSCRDFLSTQAEEEFAFPLYQHPAWIDERKNYDQQVSVDETKAEGKVLKIANYDIMPLCKFEEQLQDSSSKTLKKSKQLMRRLLVTRTACCMLLHLLRNDMLFGVLKRVLIAPINEIREHTSSFLEGRVNINLQQIYEKLTGILPFLQTAAKIFHMQHLQVNNEQSADNFATQFENARTLHLFKNICGVRTVQRIMVLFVLRLHFDFSGQNNADILQDCYDLLLFLNINEHIPDACIKDDILHELQKN